MWNPENGAFGAPISDSARFEWSPFVPIGRSALLLWAKGAFIIRAELVLGAPKSEKVCLFGPEEV